MSLFFYSLSLSLSFCPLFLSLSSFSLCRYHFLFKSKVTLILICFFIGHFYIIRYYIITSYMNPCQVSILSCNYIPFLSSFVDLLNHFMHLKSVYLPRLCILGAHFWYFWLFLLQQYKCRYSVDVA